MLNRQLLESYDLFKKDLVLSVSPVERQGFCNENYIVTTQKSKYIIRKLLRDDIDRDLEVKIHQHVFNKGLTSKLHLYDPQNGVMVFSYLDGEHRKRLSQEAIDQLVYTLLDLHQIDMYASSIKPLNIHKLFSSPYTEKVNDAINTIDKYVPQYALCHHDLNPYNLIWQKNGVKLIDFEYAGINDIYFDLASVSVEFALSCEEDIYLLQKYFQEDIFFTEKFYAYKLVYKALCETWFSENMKQG